MTTDPVYVGLLFGAARVQQDHLVINRKNDGTVKLTRQRATSKPHELGMTRQRKPTKLDWLLGRTVEDETLKSYLETAGQKTPRQQLNAEKRHQKRRNSGKKTDLAEYHRTVLKRVGPNFRLMLLFRGNEFLFVQESKEKRFISRTYSSREEAMQRYWGNLIAWITSEEVKPS